MPEHLQSPASAAVAGADDGSPADLRFLSRSPHPYRRQSFELLEPSSTLLYGGASAGESSPVSRSGTNSGTEADDEHFLKRLPAPKMKRNKGLRGKSEATSGTSTPLSPSVVEHEPERLRPNIGRGDVERARQTGRERVTRRRKEVARRSAECLLLGCVGTFIGWNREVQPILFLWGRELTVHSLVVAVLLGLYPVRLVSWAYRRRKPRRLFPVSVPSSFDPATILYPLLIPVFAALLIALNGPAVILPNLVLSLCALPPNLIPLADSDGIYNHLHWLLSCAPLFSSHVRTQGYDHNSHSGEDIVLLYPLHTTLCQVLYLLTSTSLLATELQLLSLALINILILSSSPQMIILKALLWGGGLSVVILCGPVIQWGITLARVPKWRFKRAPAEPKSSSSALSGLRGVMSCRRHKVDGRSFLDLGDTSLESSHSSDDGLENDSPLLALLQRIRRRGSNSSPQNASLTAGETADIPRSADGTTALSPPRRHTLPSLGKLGSKSKTHTPSGRRKRSASSTVRAYFSLTQGQAAVRKWMYAAYVHSAILAIILVGIREYVKRYALSGYEPIGWALGYLFGDLPSFRFRVVLANLESWIPLPVRAEEDQKASCRLGWVQHARHAFLGEANTRLLVSGYWLLVIITGLAVVFRLSPVCEVDTRRKVFHFMMVAMFLPATYVDPAYASLALALVLAIFLLLDLLRASQLPPLSRPIANFLAPYVDGRDLRGPVVVSHIFLLVGCAVPLWLSLAALPVAPSSSSGDRGDPYGGWEVPSRDVAMVSGVVCVGLGDAAASLVGRRWGRHKWIWGGGKSLEGSAAFAGAVFLGLVVASGWLRLGGWLATTSGYPGVCDSSGSGSGSIWSSGPDSVRKSGLCATVASLTEAVLTGGNDNVIVPVVLWTCVKSLGL
ncbi:hypothetical protein VTK73DRAFT_3836 [Phialemonium thermophilum]|uniref:dolichol kinase n=1 Tax=Phialemonium thermophilum TaxID=223376 RepID=A0ABR3WWS5_9PEZI